MMTPSVHTARENQKGWQTEFSNQTHNNKKPTMKASCAAGSSPACGQHTGALLCCGAARLQGADRPFRAAAPSVLQAVDKRKNTGEQRTLGRSAGAPGATHKDTHTHHSHMR